MFQCESNVQELVADDISSGLYKDTKMKSIIAKGRRQHMSHFRKKVMSFFHPFVIFMLLTVCSELTTPVRKPFFF